MGIRLKSLGEDYVDVYTHTWSVLFLLLLTLFTLVIPDAQQKQETDIVTGNEPYRVACWCPAHFESSQIAYSNDVCSRAFNNMIKTGVTGGVRVPWSYPKDPLPTTPGYDVNSNATRPADEDNDDNDEKDDADETKKDDDAGKPLTRFQWPVVLFILALCLRLPQIVWAALSDWCHCINLGRTLDSASKIGASNQDNKRQLYADLIQAALNFVKSNKKTASYLYMLKKMMMLLVVIAEIIVIACYALPKTEVKTSLPPKAVSKEGSHYQGDIFHCFFEIRQLSNIHHYTVQCVIHKQEPVKQQFILTESMMSDILYVLISLLAILAVANFLSIVTWASNLGGNSSKARMGLAGSTPLDLHFLVHMARINLSVDVAKGLAEHAAGTRNVDFGTGGGGEYDKIVEKC